MSILEFENLNGARDFPLFDTGSPGTEFNSDIILDAGLILASSVDYDYVSSDVVLTSFEYVGTDFIIVFSLGPISVTITVPDTHSEGDSYFSDFLTGKFFLTVGKLPPSPLSATSQSRYHLLKTKVTYLGGSGVTSIQAINEAPTPPTGVTADPISVGTISGNDVILESGRSLLLELQGTTVRFIPLSGEAALGTPNYCVEGYSFPTTFMSFGYSAPTATCAEAIKLINGQSADDSGFFSLSGGNGVSVQTGVKPSYASSSIPEDSSITVSFNLPELFNTGKDSCANPCD